MDSFRKEIQGDLMGKVDCVMEACQKSYEEGRAAGLLEARLEGKYWVSIDIAKKMLVKGAYSLEEISDVTGLPLDVVSELKKNI